MQYLGSHRQPAGCHRHVLCADSLLGLLEQLLWEIPTFTGENMAFIFSFIDNQKRDSEHSVSLPFLIVSLLLFFSFLFFF